MSTSTAVTLLMQLLSGMIWAHSLNQKATYLGFDEATLDLFQARSIAGTSLIQVGDTLGLVMKATPTDGTPTGAGGYSTFFIPLGTQVVKAEYGTMNGTSFVPLAVKGQSILALGDGRQGSKKSDALIGLTLGPNINGQTSTVVNGGGLARGTMAGLYSDTGIFYATDPKTAYQSWVNTGGMDGLALTPNDTTITNNSGDQIIPTTRWDAEQLIAFGMKAPSLAIADDGRGNTPWGMGSGVAGPESGYAWCFNKTYWDTHPLDSSRLKNSIEVGPWKRIKYAGSQASNDVPGLKSSALGYAGIDVSNMGFDLRPENPLPVTSSWTDNTSPKAVRFSWGILELNRPEYARIQIKVVNGPGQFGSDFDAGGLLKAYCDTFGGDAGGEYGNQDHLWRYYEPSTAELSGRPFVFKQASSSLLKPSDVFSYKLWVVNFSSSTQTNVVVEDSLPPNVTFLSASPAQSSGSNPLIWNYPTLPPQSVRTITVNVRAKSAGIATNTLCSTSDQFPKACMTETVMITSEALLFPDKTVSPTSASAGDVVTYTVTMQNQGTATSEAPLLITEHLPEGFTYHSLESVHINGAVAPSGSVIVDSADPALPVFTINTGVNAGQQLTLVFKAQISSSLPEGSYCNQISFLYDTKVISTGALACVTVLPPAPGLSIGNLVFHDANGDGHASANEGVAGISVELYGVGAAAGIDPPVETTVTGPDGIYSFSGLDPGLYYVHIPAAMFQAGGPLHNDISLSEQLVGDDDVGEDGLNLTDPPTQGVSSNALFLNYGFAPTDANGESGLAHEADNTYDAASNLTVDFGFQKPLSVGNLVFNDLNQNGHADAGEGIGGVLVELYREEHAIGIDLPLQSMFTTNDGHYLFTHLDAGDYVVHVAAENFSEGGVLRDLVSVLDVGSPLTADDDVGEDGVDDMAPVYHGISSSVIHLMPGAAPVDAPIGSATGETGYFANEDNSGIDTNTDLTVDFGFTAVIPPVVGVGNIVFQDLDGNRRPDSGEGVGGVTVQLFSASVVDPLNGSALRSTVTSSDGLYYFGNLQPGDYYVFIPPANFAATGPLKNALSLPGQGSDDGLDDKDGENGDDPETPAVSGVRSNDFNLAVNAEPVALTSETGDFSYVDDGIDANSDLTIDFGFYQFVGLGNMVFRDWNGNGRFDLGEGFDGVPLQLFPQGNNPEIDLPLMETTSSNGGRYSFTGLRPGNYFVHVPAQTFQEGGLLEQLVSAPEFGISSGRDDDFGEDGVDAVDPPTTGISSRVFVLSPGLAPTDSDIETGASSAGDNDMDDNFDATVDLGFYDPTSPGLGVGNVVYIDSNHNGRFDPGEGVSGVTVKLFAIGAAPLTAEPADITITNSEGAYVLTTNTTGDYFVFLPPENFEVGRPLYGYSSLPGNGGDTGIDEDVDENGIDAASPAQQGIASGTIHLEAGMEPIENGFMPEIDDGHDDGLDLTVDFGFDVICPTLLISPRAMPECVSGISYLQPMLASGGYGPYTWAVTDGALPPGITLSVTGLLSGVATEVDTYDFTLAVTDVMGCTAQKSYQLRVVLSPKLGFGNRVYHDANHNGLYDPGEGIANVEVEVFHTGENPLTDWPLLEVETDAEGFYSFEGLDEGDYVAFVPIREFEEGHPLHGLVSIFGDGISGSVDDNLPGNDDGIDHSDPAQNGVASRVIQLRFGEEPVNTSTETGSQATYDDVIIDANYDSTIDFGFREPCPPINTQPSVLPAAIKDVAYSQQITAAGGTGTLTFSLAAGALPSGMTLTSQGLLSGTTANVGSFPLTIRVADSDGCMADLVTSLLVNGKSAVGNLVFFDRNGNGHADPGEGVAGVTVRLYQGSATPETDAPLAETITADGGIFLFDELEAGSYALHVPKEMFQTGAPLWSMKSVPGVATLGDDDTGEDGQDAVDPTATGVSTEAFRLESATMPADAAESGIGGESDDDQDSNVDLTRDLGFVDVISLPPTFTEWQAQHGLNGPNGGPAGNVDGDADNNLLEYALGGDPSSGGAQGQSPYLITENPATGQMSLKLRQRHGGQADLTYEVQVIADLAQSPAGWTATSLTPSEVNNGDGTVTLTYGPLETDPATPGGLLGFVRVRFTLDANHDNTAEGTATTPVLGWQHRHLTVKHQTYSMPFAPQAVFAGTVDSVSGSAVNAATSAGGTSLAGLLQAGRQYYLEAMNGPLEGHRWEIDTAGSTASTLTLLPAAARSTLSSVPISLTGSLVAVRAHWRLADLFPPADFNATLNPNTADTLQFYDRATLAYVVYWLANAPSGVQWTRVGDVTLANRNNSATVAPMEGMFVRPRSGSPAMTGTGQVRTWKTACPLGAGTSLIGSPYPVAMSAADRMMTAANGFQGTTNPNTANKCLVWDGDTSGSATSYTAYYLFKNTSVERWLRVGDLSLLNRASEKVFLPNAASFITVQAGHPAWIIPVPWTP